jgi:hypothetical protein
MVTMNKWENGDPVSNKAATKRERERESAPHGRKKSKHVTSCLSVCLCAKGLRKVRDPWRWHQIRGGDPCA